MVQKMVGKTLKSDEVIVAPLPCIDRLNRLAGSVLGKMSAIPHYQRIGFTPHMPF